MAGVRIHITSDFAKKNARAMLVCRSCKHFVVVSQAIVNLMFPRIMPLDRAAKRLRCSRCGAKKAVIEPVHEQGCLV